MNKLENKTVNSKVIIAQILLILSFNANQLFGQEQSRVMTNKNSVYIELFGNAGYLYNLTYDRLILIKEDNKISAGLGIQYLPINDLAVDKIISLSPQVNYLRGRIHHLETGIGIAYDFMSEDLVIPFRIGYRYQQLGDGLFLKLGFTPLYIHDFFGEPAIIPWGGVGIGWTFNTKK